MVSSAAGGGLVAVASAMVLFRSRGARTDWIELFAMGALFGSLGLFLGLAVVHFFGSPLYVGLFDRETKEVWVRFPNRDYVRLIEAVK